MDRWERKIARMQEKMELHARQNGSFPGPRDWFGPTSSGNRAFDDYRSETLKRLEDEQREFKEFLARLRFAKDRAEFDQFMADRRQRPSESGFPSRDAAGGTAQLILKSFSSSARAAIRRMAARAICPSASPRQGAEAPRGGRRTPPPQCNSRWVG